jgi:hypothetical protein
MRTERGAHLLQPLAALLVAVTWLLFSVAGVDASETDRTLLSAGFLLGTDELDSPVDTAAFAPRASDRPSEPFEGRLQLVPDPAAGRTRGVLDSFGYLDDPALGISRLPEFSFEFVQSGDHLVPVRRGPQRGAHPHWEFILEPGQVWSEAGDGGWSRAALPFALQERNANCTHNGLLTFLFRSDGSISRVAYQVGSETCQYLQVDLWGVLAAVYVPGKVPRATAVIEAFRREVAARLPVKPLAALPTAYPGVAIEDFDWYPPDEVSAVGLAIDGVHYRGGCGTRYGDYPFCDVLDLPSYSLAKSIFAGMAYMALRQEAPAVAGLEVADLVPECRQGDGWQGVTLAHLLDMSTGHYESLEHDVDEFASYETPFMGGDTHVAKISTACSLFPRKAEPGSTFTYHTSDTYIAGTLMNAWLRQQAPQNPRDVYRDIVVDKVLRPLGTSPVTWTTRRTYDDVGQPFAGYGLTLHADDIVRIALFLARGDGIVDGNQVLDKGELSAALQRNPADHGVRAHEATLRYNNGFWAYRTDLGGACTKATWLPFMSGYGGISIVLMPNQSVFYVFSDQGRFEWLRAAIAVHRIHALCE